MRNEDKIKLADMLLRFIEENTEEKVMPVQVGTLNKILGLNGFKKAEVGTPVFEYQDRYIIYYEKLGQPVSVETRYYKEELAPAIEFMDK